MERTVINTPDAPAAIGPYSQAVAVGELLFCSGQIPLRPDGTLNDGDITAQTHQVFANIKALLQAGGSSLEQVVKATVFLQDMGEFAAMNTVYGEYFTQSQPARSTVQVARLPRDVRVEIEVVAVRG
ncbi:RidA family protein [Chloroflexia bacterium SDU3-3]|nr:RidA family protein [Chloroflexia bacterium SDU3-3]